MNKLGLTHDYPFMKTLALVKVELDESGEIAKYVYGVMTAESPDKEGEIANYEQTKKNVQAWSDEFVKTTSLSGQDLSLGNIRLQHDSLALGGKAVKIDFEDDAKAIKLGTVPINDEVGKALKQGYYTGYSIGGDYEYRRCATCARDIAKGSFCKTCGKNVLIEYAPIIAEVSYVDNPCHGDAHFELVKADGSKSLAKLIGREETEMDPQVAPKFEVTPEVTSAIGEIVKKALIASGVVKAEPTPEELKKQKVTNLIREQFAKSCKAKIGDVYDSLMKFDGKLAKNMYDVSELAYLLCDLAWLQNMSAWEAAYEEDESKIPAELLANLEALATTFLAMAQEEVSELTAAAAAKGENKAMKTLDAAELQKAVKPLSEHITNAKKAVSDHVTKMKKAADDHETAMHGQLDKCMKLMGAEEADTDESSKSGTNEPEAIDPTKQGTETIIKSLRDSGMIVMTQEDLTKTVESTLQSLLKSAAVADDEDEKEEDDKKKTTKKSAGVGDREVSPILSNAGGVVVSMPVIKTRDSGAASAAANETNVATETPAVSRETVEKGLAGGDIASRLALMKGVKSQSAVPATVAGAVAAAGK